MIRFDSDYLEGAHPKILKKIVETNYEQTEGYGRDEYTKSAIEKIRKICGREDADIHFLVGGTQTNMIVVSSTLRTYEAVICANTGHINVHEAGAVEACGNKIITIESDNGKIYKEQVDSIIEEYKSQDVPEHMVKPRMVFISLPTECGTNYTKEELTSLYNYCKENNLYLYIDGARLGYSLVAEDTDLTIKDVAKLCDVFYIGGTKIGAMFGEAVVILNNSLKGDFRYYIKQKGALLAKGRLLALQFDILMENELYFKISKSAVSLAMRIKQVLIEKGYTLYYDSYTNQQFVIINNNKLKELEKEFTFFKWKIIDENKIVIRICTSWATTEENVDKLIEKL